MTQNIAFHAQRERILKVLSHVNNITSRRNNLGILANVKLQGKDNTLYFTATNTDIAIKEVLREINLVHAGELLISASLLYDIVRKLPPKTEILFQVKESKFTISAQAIYFSLPFLDTNEFPLFDEINFTYKFSLSITEYQKLFTKTSFAMSNEEVRFNLHGLYFHTHNEFLLCAATDGHRLAVSKIINPIPAHFNVIIPHKTVLEYAKLVNNEVEEIYFEVVENKLLFRVNEITLLSNLVDGNFPDYKKVIPRKNNNRLTVTTNQLKEVIERVIVISNESVKMVNFKLRPEQLTVFINCGDNHAIEHLAVEYIGEELTIIFNAKYILDILTYIDTPEVSFFFATSLDPVIIRNKTCEDNLYVLMPMRQ